MTQSNVIKFPFKDLAVQKQVSQAVEKEEIVNLENIEKVEGEEVKFQSFSSEQIEKIKVEHHKIGMNEASVKLGEEFASEKANLISSINALKEKFENIEKVKKSFSEDVVNVASNLAITIARKIIGSNANLYQSKVLEFFKEIMPRLVSEETIYINLNNKHAKELEEALNDTAKSSNYTGSLKVVGNDEIAMGDCEVAWNSGSAKFNPSELHAKIDEMLSAHIAKPQEAAEQTTEKTATDVLPKEE